MLKNWRFWILSALMLGPPAVFIGLGWVWVTERGWALIAFFAWLLFGLLFGILSVVWTKSTKPVLTPIDWSAPRTFAPRDREAWSIVMAEAAGADRVSIAALGDPATYINTGLQLADRIAKHYYPRSSEALDHVPIAQLLTALELAADDLNAMVREVPGGDMMTLAHFKSAMQAANFVSKANEYYNYFLPLFQPVQGLLRLGAQKFMTQPAWRNMQQNVMQWFYRAYVQRLGTHLIELYSGRLVIGIDTYRTLTRRKKFAVADAMTAEGNHPTVVIGIAGARGSEKSALVRHLEAARNDAARIERAAELADSGGPQAIGAFRAAVIRELEGYSNNAEKESLRERWSRNSAMEGATRSDLLVLVIDATRDDFRADARFVQEWLDWYENQRGLEVPACLIVLTGGDRPEILGATDPETPKAEVSPSTLAAAMRGRIEVVRRALPSNLLATIVPLAISAEAGDEVAVPLVVELLRLMTRGERTALIRHLHDEAARSKVGRFMNQVGRQSSRAWDQLADNVKRHVPRFGPRKDRSKPAGGA